LFLAALFLARFVLMGLHIMEKTSRGKSICADLGLNCVEIPTCSITAIGENVSSDPVNGEAQLLRKRFATLSDPLSAPFHGIDDPA
jgi:hypothetical protein